MVCEIIPGKKDAPPTTEELMGRVPPIPPGSGSIRVEPKASSLVTIKPVVAGEDNMTDLEKAIARGEAIKKTLIDKD